MQPSDLESGVNRQSWEWLAELPPRLDIVIEVIDAHYAPLFPVGSAPDALALRRMLTTGEPSIRSALSDAVRSKTALPVAVESLQVLCVGLAPGGVLLLARRLTGGASADECRQDLESIGTWLTGAIEASLAQPNTISVESYRIVSFRRILREATSRGSIRKVMGAFVEALSVWDDVRVRGYIAGASGGFFQYVSPMAALPSSSPDQLDDAVIPRTGRIRLSRAEVERLGLAGEPGDVLILRISTGTDVAWLLLFSGMIDDREQVRLRVYTDMLRESLTDVLATTTGRVVAEVARHQLPSNEPLETAVQTALGRLTDAVGGRHGALAVTTATGRQTLAVGNTDLLATIDQARFNRLAVRSSDAGSIMSVVIEREQAPFTAFEREILQAGVVAVHPWVQAALQRTHDIERRRRVRPVDTMFDQLATEAVAGGQQASVIVMSVDAATLRPGLLSTWVGRIRAQLRGGDFAGVVSDGEIAILLCGASAEQAAVVSVRLKQTVEFDDSTGAFVHPAIGMTTRSPGSPFEGSLVGAARASASALP